MDVDWHGELMGQMEFAWDVLLRPRFVGLTDAEYGWEPVEGCWSVRPRPDGTGMIDFEHPAPEPPPVTTIGWRVCHIAMAFTLRSSNHFGDGSWSPWDADWPLTADGGLAWLDESYTAWRDAVAARPELLGEPCGPSEGPYAEHPFATLVLHLNRELSHHGAEIGVLRDLYRAGLR